MTRATATATAASARRAGTRRSVPELHVLGVAGDAVPPGTESLLAGAQVVAGGRAVLERLAPGKEHVVLGKDLDATLRALVQRAGVVVLASGDPGFFGIVRALS